MKTDKELSELTPTEAEGRMQILARCQSLDEVTQWLARPKTLNVKTRPHCVRMKPAVCFFVCLLLAGSPVWGAQHVNVKEAGAKGDGKADDSAAIQRSIDQAAGATVLFPSGNYVIGAIRLPSDTSLELSAGTTLAGSIRVRDAANVVILGRDRKTSLVRGYMGFRNCRGVRLRDFNQEAMSGQGFDSCEDVTLSGVTIRQPPRRQGGGSAIWLNGCRNVLATECDFSSNDDVFCLKRSGENIHLKDSLLVGHLAAPYKIGTETDGDFRNISMTHCTIKDSDRGAISIESVDGSNIDGVYISDIRMENVAAPLFIRLGNRARYGGRVGSIRNISIHGIESTGGSKDDGIGPSIVGLPGHPVENVTITNVRATYQGGGTPEDANRKPKELPTAYPEYDMFGRLPAYGLYVRHASGVVLRDVSIKSVKPDGRPALVADDVDGLVLDRFSGAAAAGAEASLRFEKVRRALVRDAALPADVSLLHLLPGSDEITLLGQSLHAAERPPAWLAPGFPGTLRIEPLAAPVVEELNVGAARVGESPVVAVGVDNAGPAGYASLELTADGKPVDRRWFWMKAGEKRRENLSGPCFETAGEHVLRVAGAVRKIDVAPAPGWIVCERFDVPPSARAGQPLVATIAVRNAGSEAKTETVRLVNVETELAVREITLGPGERRQMELPFRLDEPGLRLLKAGGNSCQIAINPVWIDGNRNGVQDRGEKSFGTIAGALAAAAPGDRICLQPGQYGIPADELPLVIETPGVSISSASGRGPAIVEAHGTIEQAGRRHSVFYVAADDVTLDGLVIRGGYHGVFVDGAARTVVRNCTLEMSKHYNIALARPREARIETNTSQTGGNGFLGMFRGEKSVIEGNRVEDDACGIRLIQSTGCGIRGNALTAALWYGILLEHATGNLVEKNQIDRSRLCGIELRSASGNRVIGNSIVGSKTEAILLTGESKDNVFEANRLEGNRLGAIISEFPGAAGPSAHRRATGKVLTGGIDLTTPVPRSHNQQHPRQ